MVGVLTGLSGQIYRSLLLAGWLGCKLIGQARRNKWAIAAAAGFLYNHIMKGKGHICWCLQQDLVCNKYKVFGCDSAYTSGIVCCV